MASAEKQVSTAKSYKNFMETSYTRFLYLVQPKTSWCVGKELNTLRHNDFPLTLFASSSPHLYASTDKVTVQSLLTTNSALSNPEKVHYDSDDNYGNSSQSNSNVPD